MLIPAVNLISVGLGILTIVNVSPVAVSEFGQVVEP